MNSAPNLLDVRGVCKQFPGVKALDGVELQVRKGEVHALLGENGAGKSTLLKILSGALRADRGEVTLDGVTLEPSETPRERQRAGLVTIYQEFNLLPFMSIAENLYLGREPERRGFIDWAAMHDNSRALADKPGIERRSKAGSAPFERRPSTNGRNRPCRRAEGQAHRHG